jgi:hypothetical protein
VAAAVVLKEWLLPWAATFILSGYCVCLICSHVDISKPYGSTWGTKAAKQLGSGSRGPVGAAVGRRGNGLKIKNNEHFELRGESSSWSLGVEGPCLIATPANTGTNGFLRSERVMAQRIPVENRLTPTPPTTHPPPAPPPPSLAALADLAGELLPLYTVANVTSVMCCRAAVI